MLVKNGFKYQIMFKYDGVPFDREWYSINCSRNTDLDLYKMILHNLAGCMYVCRYSYMANYLLCLFTAHVTIYSYIK